MRLGSIIVIKHRDLAAVTLPGFEENHRAALNIF